MKLNGAEASSRDAAPWLPSAISMAVPAQAGAAHGAGQGSPSRTSHGVTQMAASDNHWSGAAMRASRAAMSGPHSAASAPRANSHSRAGSEKNATFASVIASTPHAANDAANTAASAAICSGLRSRSTAIITSGQTR